LHQEIHNNVKITELSKELHKNVTQEKCKISMFALFQDDIYHLYGKYFSFNQSSIIFIETSDFETLILKGN